VLLKVEKGNRRAEGLYYKIGYRKVAVETNGEKPNATSGRLRFMPVTNVVMRKDLKFPPIDTVVSLAGVALCMLCAVSYWSSSDLSRPFSTDLSMPFVMDLTL